MKKIKKLLELFSIRERKQAVLLLAMILIMAMLDMIGVASIMPFMAVLANPQLIENNAILSMLYSKLGFTDPKQFLFALGILVFILLVLSLGFKALTTYVQLRFTLMREYTIGKRLVEGYLHQPYSWFLSRNSADLGKTILSEVNQVIGNGVTPMMTLIAQGAVASALLLLLILIDPNLALIVGLTLSIAYVLVFKITRGFLARIGEESLKANQKRFIAISEAFGASKEIKVGCLEQAYIQRFSVPAKIYARHQASATVISQLPRFALEAIAFGGMLLVVLYLMTQNGDFASALPVIALYAFAGYRLMPALQQIYGAVTQLGFIGPALDALHADLMSLKSIHEDPSHCSIQFKKAISLNNVTYYYPNTPHPALKKLSLEVHALSTVGIVGTTGSGKTTMADLVLGLLEAQKGFLEVDGQIINEHNRKSWQSVVGYVPQQIYLADDTIYANIAFGIDPDKIDQMSVQRAARIANLHDFIVSDLPNQYQTTIGERGVRLSGGQRQRIGIARALYHNPHVLILDEATSALDNLTEQAVMDAVSNLSKKITIIIIAHRLSTVRACDKIFLLEKGELKAEGTFEEFCNTSSLFSVVRDGL